MKYTLILFVACIFSVYVQAQETTVSTYYLIRHAEKVISDNPNPELSPEGAERAIQWLKIFENIQFDAIYSTDYIRTRNTVDPTSKSQGIDVTLYHPLQIEYSEFIEQTQGETVLIVGHSNTIPSFVNKLLGELKYQELDESIYGNLYIVNIIGSTKKDILLNLE